MPVPGQSPRHAPSAIHPATQLRGQRQGKWIAGEHPLPGSRPNQRPYGMRHAEVIDSWRRRGDLGLGLVLLLPLRLPVLGVPMVGALLGFLVGVADAQKRL